MMRPYLSNRFLWKFRSVKKLIVSPIMGKQTLPGGNGSERISWVVVSMEIGKLQGQDLLSRAWSRGNPFYNAILHIGVARNRRPSACITLRTVAKSGLLSIDNTSSRLSWPRPVSLAICVIALERAISSLSSHHQARIPIFKSSFEIGSHIFFGLQMFCHIPRMGFGSRSVL